MPETLEAPRTFVPPFSDPEFARQAATKAHKAIADLKADGERFREMALEQAKAGPPPKPIDSAEALQEVKQQLSLTEELIAHARNRLLTCDDKAASGLIREIRSLQEHRCRLLNIAQAPTSKALPARSRATQAPPAPQPVVVQPVPQKPVEPVV